MVTGSSKWLVCCCLVLLSASGAFSQVLCGSETLEDISSYETTRSLTEGYNISNLVITAPVIESVEPKSMEIVMKIKIESTARHLPFSAIEVYVTEENCEHWRLAVMKNALPVRYVWIHILEPSTIYKVAVRGTLLREINSNFSEVVTVKTLPGKPDPPKNLQFTVIGNGKGRVSWDAPEHMNGDLEKYIISYAFDRSVWETAEATTAHFEVDIPVGANVFNAFAAAKVKETKGGVQGGVGEPSKPLTFDLRTNAIQKDSIWQELQEGAKSLPRIEVMQINKHDIIVRVETPENEASQPPRLVVLYKEVSSFDWVEAATIENKQSDYVAISGLMPYTRYHVACKTASAEVPSDLREVATLPDSPGRVRNVKYACPVSGAVQVMWKVPAVTNGVIAVYRVGYQILLSGSNWEYIFTPSTVAVIPVPPEAKKLFFWVTAHTAPNEDGLGGGNSHYTPTIEVRLAACFEHMDNSLIQTDVLDLEGAYSL